MPSRKCVESDNVKRQKVVFLSLSHCWRCADGYTKMLTQNRTRKILIFLKHFHFAATKQKILIPLWRFMQLFVQTKRHVEATQATWICPPLCLIIQTMSNADGSKAPCQWLKHHRHRRCQRWSWKELYETRITRSPFIVTETKKAKELSRFHWKWCR